MMTERRDGPAEVVAHARSAVLEALSAWLVSPYEMGAGAAGGPDDRAGYDDIVIYGPDESRYELNLALDAKRGKRLERTIYLTSDMFYRQGAGNEGWLLIDSRTVREHLRTELERAVGKEGLLVRDQEGELYRTKAIRSLAAGLPSWKWLKEKLGTKPKVEAASNSLLIIKAGKRLVTQFGVTFDRAAAGEDVLLLSLDLFHHPAVRDWELLNQAGTWRTLREALEPRL